MPENPGAYLNELVENALSRTMLARMKQMAGGISGKSSCVKW